MAIGDVGVDPIGGGASPVAPGASTKGLPWLWILVAIVIALALKG